MTELVHYDVRDDVATITLDSPHNRNALSRQLTGELAAALERAAGEAAAKVVLLQAAGTVFCSGADLSEAATVPMDQGARVIVALQRAIVAHPKPVVARVAGAVRAGGIGLVAASDIVIAAEDASFALTEVRLGLAPAAISLTVLPRLTGRAAADTFLTGRVFTGLEAQDMGLVTTAVPADRLDAEVEVAVTQLRSGAPQGLRETKALMNAALLERIDGHGEEMATLSARLFGSDEARAAMLAFLSKK